ncbi:hypothetical protein [Bradyrhizobium sp. AZCC 1693]|uniref:hypothetical protein n=1 Tax=Bradyrhizobium sp. AZCC 1693 TaxID=3117029 RepID=UPI002FF1CF79
MRQLTTGDRLEGIGAVILLPLGGLPLSGPAFAQARDKAPKGDRPLLATFCDAGNIKGSACKPGQRYRSGKAGGLNLLRGGRVRIPSETYFQKV